MQTEARPNIKLPVQHPAKGGLYRRYIKRPMDFVLSLCAIIVLSPILLIVAVLVRVKLGSPVIFKQERSGLNENIFMMYKFRTMAEERDADGNLLPDSTRLTKFGRILRSTSLDELLELFNILKGDMSIIGPRPLLIQYLPLYNDHQKRRHETRPGLSGLAQVSGRNSINWEDKFNLDVQYVDTVSFIGDWKIIYLTLKKAFMREGINSDTTATMEPFKGTVKERVNYMTSKNKLLIIGGSGHGRVVADIAIKTDKYTYIAFLDDDETIKSTMDIEIIGSISDADKYISDYDIFVAIGSNSTRERIQCQLENMGATIPVLIHPNAVIGEKVTIGIGSVAMAGAVINCGSTIGKGCIVNTASSIDHDNVLEDYVHISPGAHLAGTVSVGKGTWIGIGASVSNNINITSGCKIGAGGVVVRDITEAGTYIGVPARRV